MDPDMTSPTEAELKAIADLIRLTVEQLNSYLEKAYRLGLDTDIHVDCYDQHGHTALNKISIDIWKAM